MDSNKFLAKSCTPDNNSPWVLFLRRCLSSWRWDGFKFSWLILFTILFDKWCLNSLFTVLTWLLYWSPLGVTSETKNSQLNLVWYALANVFILTAMSLVSCAPMSFIPMCSIIWCGLSIWFVLRIPLALFIFPHWIHYDIYVSFIFI